MLLTLYVLTKVRNTSLSPPPLPSRRYVIINPYAAGTEYIRFQATFRPIHSTQNAEMFCDRCLVNLLIHFKDVFVHNNNNFFRHLELEIALAIPASNE